MDLFLPVRIQQIREFDDISLVAGISATSLSVNIFYRP